MMLFCVLVLSFSVFVDMTLVCCLVMLCVMLRAMVLRRFDIYVDFGVMLVVVLLSL